MPVTSDLGRPLLAGTFVAGGYRQLKDPAAGVEAAERVVAGPLGRVLDAAGAPSDPHALVRLNGAVQLTAGTTLALGIMPRLSAAVLAASVVPTTVGAHAFWTIDDPEQRRVERAAFGTNLAVLGGLLMTAGDTGGRPSLGWLARRRAAETRRDVEELRANVEELRTSARADVEELRRSTRRRVRDAGRQARRVVDEVAHDVSELPERASEAASRRAAETVGRATLAVGRRAAGRRARKVVDEVAHDVSELPDRATELASRKARETVGRATIFVGKKAAKRAAAKRAHR